MSEDITIPDPPPRCRYGNLHGGEGHRCPYQCDVGNDPDFRCQCCEKCEQDCCDDI